KNKLRSRICPKESSGNFNILGLKNGTLSLLVIACARSISHLVYLAPISTYNATTLRTPYFSIAHNKHASESNPPLNNTTTFSVLATAIEAYGKSPNLTEITI